MSFNPSHTLMQQNAFMPSVPLSDQKLMLCRGTPELGHQRALGLLPDPFSSPRLGHVSCRDHEAEPDLRESAADYGHKQPQQTGANVRCPPVASPAMRIEPSSCCRRGTKAPAGVVLPGSSSDTARRGRRLVPRPSGRALCMLVALSSVCSCAAEGPSRPAASRPPSSGPPSRPEPSMGEPAVAAFEEVALSAHAAWRLPAWLVSRSGLPSVSCCLGLASCRWRFSAGSSV